MTFFLLSYPNTVCSSVRTSAAVIRTVVSLLSSTSGSWTPRQWSSYLLRCSPEPVPAAVLSQLAQNCWHSRLCDDYHRKNTNIIFVPGVRSQQTPLLALHPLLPKALPYKRLLSRIVCLYPVPFSASYIHNKNSVFGATQCSEIILNRCIVNSN